MSNDERLLDKKLTYQAARRAYRAVKDEIWRADLKSIADQRAAEVAAFRKAHPMTADQRLAAAIIIDALDEDGWDRSYDLLVEMLK